MYLPSGGAVLFTGGSYPIHRRLRVTRRLKKPSLTKRVPRIFLGDFKAVAKKRLKKVSNSLNSRWVFLPRKEVNLRHVPKCLKALPTLPLNQQQKHLKIDA